MICLYVQTEAEDPHWLNGAPAEDRLLPRVMRDMVGPGSEYRVSQNVGYLEASGALVLSFRLLFRRNPGPGEGDYIITIP